MQEVDRNKEDLRFFRRADSKIDRDIKISRVRVDASTPQGPGRTSQSKKENNNLSIRKGI